MDRADERQILLLDREARGVEDNRRHAARQGLAAACAVAVERRRVAAGPDRTGAVLQLVRAEFMVAHQAQPPIGQRHAAHAVGAVGHLPSVAHRLAELRNDLVRKAARQVEDARRVGDRCPEAVSFGKDRGGDMAAVKGEAGKGCGHQPLGKAAAIECDGGPFHGRAIRSSGDRQAAEV